MVSAQKLAYIRRDAGELNEARELLNQAIEIGDELLRSDPGNAQARADLYASYDGLARLHLSSDPHAADTVSTAALQLMRDLPEEDSDHSLWRGKLGVALKLRGLVLLELGRTDEGHDTLRDACDQLRQQLDEDAGDPYLMLHLANALDRLGKACKQLGRIADELGHYEEAYRLRSELHDASPDLAAYAEQLIISHTKIGEWYFDRKTPDHDRLASEWYRRADEGLRLLESSSKLRGREAKFDPWRDEIDDYRDQLADRLGRVAKQ